MLTRYLLNDDHSLLTAVLNWIAGCSGLNVLPDVAALHFCLYIYIYIYLFSYFCTPIAPFCSVHQLGAKLDFQIWN
jgi:hypothetical protein